MDFVKKIPCNKHGHDYLKMNSINNRLHMKISLIRFLIDYTHLCPVIGCNQSLSYMCSINI